MNHRSLNKMPRSEVLKAALDLFSRKGYSETKMVEIARNVDLSVGALYLRFRSKEMLCLELIEDQTKDFIERTENLSAENPLKSIEEYIALNLHYALRKRQLISLFMREHNLPFMQPLRNNFFRTQRKIIERILTAGVKKRVFKPLNCRETASMIFAGIRGAVLLKVVYGVGNVREMSHSLFELITNGIKEDSS